MERLGNNGGDPHWNEVVLLMYGDGADEGTVFTDEKAHAFTRAGLVKTDSTQTKFGQTCSLFNPGAAADKLSTPTSGDWALAKLAWTMEAWLYSGSVASQSIFTVTDAAGTNAGSQFIFRKINPDNKLQFVYLDTGGTAYVSPAAATTCPLNEWFLASATCDGNTVWVHQNGILQSTLDVTAVTMKTIAQPLYVTSAQYSQALNGWATNLRITKGVARYSASNYAVPTARFPNFLLA